MMKQVKSVISELIDVGMLLLALAIIASLLFGGVLPFFGSVVDNITDLVAKLGNAGMVGLIALGIILWLFNKR